MEQASSKRKPGENRSLTQREEDLAKIAEMDRRGYSQMEIAAAVGMAQSTVHKELENLRRWYAERKFAERDALVAEKLAQYREIRKEAWEAYERSKEDSQKRVEEHVPWDATGGEELDGSAGKGKGRKAARRSGQGKQAERHQSDEELREEQEREISAQLGTVIGQGKKVKVVTTIEGRLPAVEYLRIVKDCLDAERELTIPKDPDELHVKATVINWDLLAGSVRRCDRPEDDSIEQEIRKVGLGRDNQAPVESRNGPDRDVMGG
jgi:predicted transcriptional regulator